MAKYFGEEYMVVVNRKSHPGGYFLVDTFRTMTKAKEAYKRLVDPKNPHSLDLDVWITQIVDAHHQKRG
jgi:hypothetical protein